MLSSETKRRIDSCRDILVGQLPLPTDQVELITLALIYKFMDDLDEQSVQLGGKRSFFIKDLADFRWRSLMPQTVSAADRVRLFADGLEALGDPKTGKHLPEMFRDIFRNAMLKFRDGRILSLFLTELDGFAYSHSEELGNAFEYLLQSMGAQGENGQFRTPRHIIDFIVEVLEPKPEDKILDPACGTGGFLVSAYKHILGKNTSKKSTVRGDELSPAKKEKLTQQLNGYDITPMMVKLSKVNMFLHGFSDPQIHEYDTLSNDARWNEKYDLIMANPPFMTPKGGVVPHTKFRIAAKKAEVLFTDYIAEHLSTNGRAGIIVPEGIIFQSATAYKALRKFLVEDSLVAVISLPAGVFNPYSGVKTSILILDKGLAHKTNSIAFFKVENDGYDLCAQRRPIDKNDLPRLTKEIHEYLEKLRSGKKISDKDEMHIVPKEKVAANGEYNLVGERYRESALRVSGYTEVKLGDAAVIVARQSPPGDSYNESGSGAPFYHGKTEFTEMYIGEPRTWTTDPQRFAESDSILISVRAPVGPVNLTINRICIGRGLAAIKPKKDKLLSLYAFYYLRSQEKNIKGDAGAVFASISRNDIEEIQIPLPPLEIQKEIVAEIEGYQKVIDGARAVVENYKPQITIDPEWPVVGLGEIAEVTSSKRILAEEYVPTGTPFYRTKEIVELSRGNDISLELFISKERFESIKARFGAPVKGELLISAVGTIGVSWVVHDEREFYFKDGNLLWIRSLAKLDPYFLKHCLDSTFAGGTDHIVFGAAYKALTIERLKEFRIPIPSLSKQKAIVAEMEKEQAMVNANKELIARFEKRIQAVMDRVWGNGTTE